jgi:uncharacterized protein YjiS (DUF1127 family)
VQRSPTIHLPSAAASAGSSARGTLRRGLARFVAALRLWRDERRTIAEIARLDEATLRDIGVDRCQVPALLAAERERIAAYGGLRQGPG